MELQHLKQPVGIEILKKLKKKRGYVNGTKGNSLTVKAIIQDPEEVAGKMAGTWLTTKAQSHALIQDMLRAMAL